MVSITAADVKDPPFEAMLAALRRRREPSEPWKAPRPRVRSPGRGGLYRSGLRRRATTPPGRTSSTSPCSRRRRRLAPTRNSHAAGSTRATSAGSRTTTFPLDHDDDPGTRSSTSRPPRPPGTIKACWLLYNADGTSTGDAIVCGHSERVFAAPGAYVLRVFDLTYDGAGTYDVSRDDRPGDAIAPPTATTNCNRDEPPSPTDYCNPRPRHLRLHPRSTETPSATLRRPTAAEIPTPTDTPTPDQHSHSDTHRDREPLRRPQLAPRRPRPRQPLQRHLLRRLPPP